MDTDRWSSWASWAGAGRRRKRISSITRAGVGEELLPLGGEGDALVAPVEQEVARLVSRSWIILPRWGWEMNRAWAALLMGAQLGHLQKALQMLQADVVMHPHLPLVSDPWPRSGTLYHFFTGDTSGALCQIVIIAMPNGITRERKIFKT